MKGLSNNQEFIDEFMVEEPVEVEEEIIEEIAEEPAEEPEFKGITIGKVIGGFLNLRVAPSKEADIIAIMPEETQVYFKGEKEEIEGFVKVRAEEFGLEGFAMEKFIEWIEE